MQRILSVGGLLLIPFLVLSIWNRNQTERPADRQSVGSVHPAGSVIAEDAIHMDPEPAPDPEPDPFGFDAVRYEIETAEIKRNESLYLILSRYGLTPLQIDMIQREASDLVNLRHLRSGQRYRIYKKDGEAVAMVWKMDRLEHLILSWEEEITARRDRFEPERVVRSASGQITHSLYETLREQGLPQLLGYRIAEILAWEIDFFALQRGDSFKVIYDELRIDGEFYGIGELHSIEFNHWGENYRAYRFDNGEQAGYFDEEGNSLQKALLKAPFTYNQRVSSRFSNNRFHPILRVNRPHHGVDYAAPRGTPVIAVGDGLVTEAQRRGGNGNIVQIRHNGSYRTAYLHLDGFAPGIRKGVRVKQGQVIGYVGRTGLATGYHLCYRLYLNDRPVNSLTHDLPSSEGLSEEYLPAFQKLRAAYDLYLASIPSPGDPGTFAESRS